MKKRKVKRDTTAEVITGPAGTQIVRVPLARIGEHAMVDYDDYVALIKSGVSLAWFASAGKTRRYVCVKRDHRVVPIARLIVGAGKGQVVGYRDGNPMNLQRANLH